jgi:K+:H+ antiporter
MRFMTVFDLLPGLALAALAALLCGAALMRFRHPPVAGYVVAGIVLGPGALGAVPGEAPLWLLAELGAAPLLFVIGAQLSMRVFLATWKSALTVVALQTGVGITAMLAGSWLLGLSATVSVLLGFAVALSSATVATMMLHVLGAARGRVGRVTIGILIAQAFAFLPMLFLVEQLGTGDIGAELIGKIVIAAALLAMLVKLLNRRRGRINLPIIRGVNGQPDLAPLTALIYGLAAAAAFGFLGLSASYGALLAGLVIGGSNQRRRMMAPFRAVQPVLVMVFFLAIGLLTDLAFLWNNLASVLFLVLLVAVIKTATNVVALRGLGQPWRDACAAGLSTAPLGEFSIVLAGAAAATGAVAARDLQLVIAVTALGLVLSPFWLNTARRIRGMDGRVDDGEVSLRDILAATLGADIAALRAIPGRVRHGGVRAIASGWRAGWRNRAAPLPANDDEDPPSTPESETAEPETEPDPAGQDTAQTIAAIGARVREAAGSITPDPASPDPALPENAAPEIIENDRTEGSNR